MAGLAEELKNLRRLHNMSLQDAADRMNISKQYLSMLEQGKRLRVSFETAIQITRCYGITLDYLAQYAIQQEE